MKADGIFTGFFPTPAEKDPRVQIESFPWPVICAVNGFAITGGFELALAADILIASENASFADTHSKFGIAPAWGLSNLTRSDAKSRVANCCIWPCRFPGQVLSWTTLNPSQHFSEWLDCFQGVAGSMGRYSDACAWMGSFDDKAPGPCGLSAVNTTVRDHVSFLVREVSRGTLGPAHIPHHCQSIPWLGGERAEPCGPFWGPMTWGHGN